MSQESKPHVVQQGEYIDKLAFQRGVTPDEVWDDPANADLKKRRKSRTVLLPGDVVHLPEAPRAGLAFDKGASHRFTAQVPKRVVKVVLASERGPYADHPYKLLGLPQRKGEAPVEGTTGARGEIELRVPITVREVGVLLTRANVRYDLQIGAVDPIDEPSGIHKRLQNLGYIGARARFDDAALGSALRAFQADQALPTTGVADDATRAALAKASGQEA